MRDAASTRELLAIQRKLDRWELEHLREHAADMAQQLDALQAQVAAARAEIEELTRQLHWADDRADMFGDMNRQLMDRLDVSVGLTQRGNLVLMEGAAHV